MLYLHGNDHKRNRHVQVGLRGIGHGMRRVTDDPASKVDIAPGGKPKRVASGNGHDGTLPDPEWNKDIRAYYDAVVNEPVPQEFVDLLQQISKEISE
jgi:hypothetical protein